MVAICKTWSLTADKRITGLCSMKMLSETERVMRDSCPICVTPLNREPPVDCFGCPDIPGDDLAWPLSYTLYGSFGFTTTVLNSQTYTAEDANYYGERTAVSFSWSATDVIAFIENARLINTFAPDFGSGNCYWGKAVSRMNFLQFIGAVDVNAAGGCGTARNHSPEWRLFVTDNQEMKWPLYAGGDNDPVYDPLTNGWILPAGTTQKYSVLNGRVWPTGYGNKSGTPAAKDVNQGEIAGYISDLPYYPDCPTIISGFLPHDWFSAAYQKSITMLLEKVTVFGSPRYSLTISVNNGGIPQKSMYLNKATGKWIANRPFGPPIEVTDPVPVLQAARIIGCIYRSEVNCDNRSVITLTRFSGSTEWPETVYLEAA